MHELVAPSVNFIALVAGLVFLLRKPIREMVATRSTTIKAQVEEAQAQKTEAQRRYSEFSAKLEAFEIEAKNVLESARQEAEATREKIVHDAKLAAERIIKDAAASAQSNVEEYKDQIRRETIGKAVELAERMIRERLSTEDQRRIVTEYVGKVQQQ